MDKIKHLIIYTFLLVILAVSTDLSAQGFGLMMSASEIERSKDSHTAEYSVVIDVNTFFFSKETSGYGAEDPEKKYCQFSETDLTSIYNLIKELGLLKSDTTTNDKNVVGTYFTCNLTIVDENGRYEIMVNGADDHFDNEELVINVKRLLSEFKSRALDC